MNDYDLMLHYCESESKRCKEYMSANLVKSKKIPKGEYNPFVLDAQLYRGMALAYDDIASTLRRINENKKGGAENDNSNNNP